MSTTITQAKLDADGLQALSNQAPDWLKTGRGQAFEAFQAERFPTRQDEAWRRTDPDRVKPEDHQVASPTTEFGAIGEVEKEEVVFTTLEQAVQEHPDLVKEHLYQIAPAKGNHFAALNSAFWVGGSFFHIGKEQSTGEGALTVSHRFPAGEKSAAAPRSLLVTERFSKASVIETFQTDDDQPLLAAPTVEIHVAEGSTLTYVMIHEWGKKTSAVPTIHARLEKDSNLQVLFVGIGGKLAKVFVESDLIGQGCKSEVLGIVLAGGRQHYDIDIQQNHRVGDNVSDVLCHVALTGKARSVFSGNVLCEPDSQRIDGYQQNRNLILSPDARADSMPKLEIEANDVRCTHGATFTTYDEAQKFYLQSRGLTAEEAERLLVTGFFQEVIHRNSQEPVVEFLEGLLAERMEKVLDQV